jgi:hypothetical protein
LNGTDELVGAVFQFTLPNAEAERMNSLPAAHQTGEPREDTWGLMAD